MNTAENLATVDRIYAAFGAGDIPTLLGMLAEDVVWQNPGPDEFEYFGTKKGVDEVARTFEFVNSRMGVTRFEPQNRFAEGDRVYSLLMIEGVADTGLPWGGRVVHEFTFGPDGRVSAFLDTQDNHRLATALRGPTKNAGVQVPDAVTAAPDVYHVLLENDRVRVLEIGAAPGTTTAMHHHPAQVAVAITDAAYRFTGSDGHAFDAVLSAGDAMYLDPVDHKTEIIGAPGSKVLLIELKP